MDVSSRCSQSEALSVAPLTPGQNYNEGLGLAMVLGVSGYNGRDRSLGDV